MIVRVIVQRQSDLFQIVLYTEYDVRLDGTLVRPATSERTETR